MGEAADPMMVLVICRPDPAGDRSIFADTVTEEAVALRELKATGVLARAWSPGGPGAVLILEVPGPTEAADVAARLPLAAAGLITTEVIPLHPLEL